MIEQKTSGENKKSVPYCVAVFFFWVINTNHTEKREHYRSATFLHPNSDSVKVLLMLASSSLVFFPFLCSHLQRCKSTPPSPTPQTHQIELSMLSGPQSSEHKCQLDYQSNWDGISTRFQSRELGWELRCSREDSNSQNPHLNREEQWGGGNSLSLLRLIFSTHRCTLHATHACINNDTQDTKFTFGWAHTLIGKACSACLVSWNSMK